MTDRDYQNAETLRRLYWGEKLSTVKISKRFDVTPRAISYWMEKHGIDRRENGHTRDEPYHDATLLRELYHDKGLNMHEIAEKLDCSVRTIGVWMDKFGIERDVPPAERPPHYYTHIHGYEMWTHKTQGRQFRVRVHRLLAVAKYGYETVADMDVHHKNNIPWLNTYDNIELMSRSEHARLHGDENSERQRKLIGPRR